jgi:hypothetical protein
VAASAAKTADPARLKARYRRERGKSDGAPAVSGLISHSLQRSWSWLWVVHDLRGPASFASASASTSPHLASAVSAENVTPNIGPFPVCNGRKDGVTWKSPSGIRYVCRYVEGAGWQWVPILSCPASSPEAQYGTKLEAACRDSGCRIQPPCPARPQQFAGPGKAGSLIRGCSATAHRPGARIGPGEPH